eukprot:tig00021275_g19877.t1
MWNPPGGQQPGQYRGGPDPYGQGPLMQPRSGSGQYDAPLASPGVGHAPSLHHSYSAASDASGYNALSASQYGGSQLGAGNSQYGQQFGQPASPQGPGQPYGGVAPDRRDSVTSYSSSQGPQPLTFTPTAQAKIETWRLEQFDKVTREQIKTLTDRLAVVSAEHKELYSRVQATAIPDGVIKIRVFRGTNLKAMDPNGLSDPYVIMRFVPINKAGMLRTAMGMPESLVGQAQQEHRTEVCPKTLNPVFNGEKVYEFTVEQKHFVDEHGHAVQAPRGPHIAFRVMDEDLVKDDFLGYFVIEWDRIATEFSAPGSRAVLDLSKQKWKDQGAGEGCLEVHINYERKVPHTPETFADSQRLNSVTAEMRHLTTLVNQKTARMIDLCKTRFERARHDLATFAKQRTQLYAEQNRLNAESTTAASVNGTLLVTPVRCEGTKAGFNLFGTADVYVVFRVNDGNRLTVPGYQERDDTLCPCVGETPVYPMPSNKVVIFDERAGQASGGSSRWPYPARVSKPSAYLIVDVFHKISGTPRKLVPLVNRCLGRVHIPLLDILHLPPGERTFGLEGDPMEGFFGSDATGSITLKFEFRQEAAAAVLLDPALKAFEEQEKRATLDLMHREIEFVTGQMQQAEADMKLFEQLRLQFDSAEKNNMLARSGTTNMPVLPLAT